MATISIWLYGKPSWDLPIEGKTHIDPTLFRKRGDSLKEHLYWVAETIKKLQSAGWELAEAYHTLYSLELCKGLTKQETKKELKKLGIQLKLGTIEDYDED